MHTVWNLNQGWGTKAGITARTNFNYSQTQKEETFSLLLSN